MKTEFNLLPASYFEPVEPGWKRFLREYGAFVVMFLCFLQFFVCALALVVVFGRNDYFIRTEAKACLVRGFVGK